MNKRYSNIHGLKKNIMLENTYYNENGNYNNNKV